MLPCLPPAAHGRLRRSCSTPHPDLALQRVVLNPVGTALCTQPLTSAPHPTPPHPPAATCWWPTMPCCTFWGRRARCSARWACTAAWCATAPPPTLSPTTPSSRRRLQGATSGWPCTSFQTWWTRVGLPAPAALCLSARPPARLPACLPVQVCALRVVPSTAVGSPEQPLAGGPLALRSSARPSLGYCHWPCSSHPASSLLPCPDIEPTERTCGALLNCYAKARDAASARKVGAAGPARRRGGGVPQAGRALVPACASARMPSLLRARAHMYHRPPT